MSVIKTVFKNISYLLIARTAFRFLTAAAMLYAANYLGGEKYGSLEIAIAWSNVFLAFNDLGMSQLIVREAARDQKKMAVYFGNTLLVEIILSTLLFFVVMAIGYGLHYDSLTLSLMAIMAIAGLVFEFRKVMRAIFRILMKLKFVALLEVLNGFFYLIITISIFTIVSDRDVGVLAIAQSRLWINVLFVVILFFYTIRFVKPLFSFKELPEMIKKSYIFTLYNFFMMVYFQIDQIILSIMKTPLDVAIYSAPTKVVIILLFIPVMVFQVSMPIMYRASKKNMDRYKRINTLLFRYITAFGIPAGIGLALLADQIIPMLFHRKEFLDSIEIMQLMGIFLAMRFIGISQGNALTTMDKEKVRAKIQMISIGVNIILDILFIYYFGVIGAAIGTLSTEIIMGSLYLFYSAKYLQEPLRNTFKMLLPIFFATIGMSFVIVLIKSSLHVIVSVLIGMCVYVLFLFLFQFFKRQDVRIFKEIIQRK